MFCNKAYLGDIRDVLQPMIIRYNAGTTKCYKEGVFGSAFFGDIQVKYNPKEICNVISFKTMKKLFLSLTAAHQMMVAMLHLGCIPLGVW